MGGGQRRLGALLLEAGAIEEPQLERALEEQRRSGRRLGRILVEQDSLDQETLFAILCRQLRLERWDAARLPSRASARALVPMSAARAARCLPLVKMEERGRETLLMATSDPLAPEAAKLVRALSDRGIAIRWVLTPDAEVEAAVMAAYAHASAASVPTGVMVVKGRPEAVGSGDHGRPRTATSGRAVPAIGVATAKVTGRTLVADDAVLEIVEDEVGAIPLAYEAPELTGLESTSAGSSRTPSPAAGARTPRPAAGARTPTPSGAQSSPRPAGADCTEGSAAGERTPSPSGSDSAPRPAADARTPRPAESASGWSERVVGGTEEPTSASPPRPVALARVAIRKAEAGFREVVSSSLLERDGRTGAGPLVEDEDISLDLVGSPEPAASARRSGPEDVVRSPAPARAREAEPKDGSSGTQLELVEELPVGSPEVASILEDPPGGREPSRETLDGTGVAPLGLRDSGELPAPRLDRDARRALFDLELDEDVPEIGPDEIEALPGAPEPSDGILTESLELADVSALFDSATPADEASTSSVVARGTVGPGEPPEGLLDVPSEAELIDGLDRPPPVAEGKAPVEATRRRAAELFEHLVRFAAGQALPESEREDAMRVIVAALLDSGALDEDIVRRLLVSDAGDG